MKKILVTGGDGLVGNAMKKFLPSSDENWVFVGRKECDLTDQRSVREMFKTISPTHVIHTAARVGGIGRNLSSPSEQYVENMLMNTFVLEEARKIGVRNLLAFSSVCAFPQDLDSFTESDLHRGPPFPAHGSYAHAKRMVDVQIEAYRNQFGLQYCSVIPGNIFGENDNFNLEQGHVVPSLIHKAFIAARDKTEFIVWGDGSPKREFIYVDDLAYACVNLINTCVLPQRIIVSGEEHSIKHIAEIILKYSGVDKIQWDTNKPNGQLKRPTQSGVFTQMFPNFIFTDVENSLKRTINWFSENFDKARK